MKNNSKIPTLGWKAFFISLIGLMGLPLVPEIVIFLKNDSDLNNFAPIAYYILIVSFLFVTPALWLPAKASRVWVGLVGLLTGGATLTVAFQAVTIGARWDLTAHSALMQTYPGQVWDFVSFFGSNPALLWLLLVLVAFVAAVTVNIRAKFPSRRLALIWTATGLVVSGFGLHNIVKYGGSPVHEVTVSGGENLTLIGVGENSFHPSVLLGLTHFNFRSTHDYYLQAYRDAALHREELMGARIVEGATPPRILLVVIGESAGRRHWSLYGYQRETTPRMDEIRDELLVFSDVISTQVGTQESIRAIFNVPTLSQPVFPLFQGAGFKTHWYSTKPDQGIYDTEISAIVQSCDHRIYLNNAYDENLLRLVEEAVASPGKHVIFLNLFGSHVRYGDRYPAEHTFFSGENEKGRILAEYDNSIRYTDMVLSRLIDLLKSQAEPSAFLYMSDHAEDVYDSTPDQYLFRNDSLATDPMYEVPFIVWASPEYRQANPIFIRGMEANRDKGATTNQLFQSMIDLARLTHPVYDPRRSILSLRYEEGERRVGATRRLYSKAEKGN